MSYKPAFPGIFDRVVPELCEIVPTEHPMTEAEIKAKAYLQKTDPSGVSLLSPMTVHVWHRRGLLAAEGWYGCRCEGLEGGMAVCVKRRKRGIVVGDGEGGWCTLRGTRQMRGGG